MRKLLVIMSMALIALLCAPAMAQEKAAAPAAGAAANNAAAASATTAPGGARRVEEVNTLEYIGEQWKAGGVTMYFLLALSFMAFAFALERVVNLTRSNIAPHGLAAQADKLWQQGQYEEVRRLAANNPSTLARVIEYIVEHRDAPMSDVSMGAGDIASEEIRKHHQRAYYLAIAATVAPLLGLFGTIVGMMGAFEVVSVAGGMGGDPGMLAKDISKALVTTAAGLLVAMPSLFVWHLFKIRTANLASLLQRESTHLLSRWLLKRKEYAGAH